MAEVKVAGRWLAQLPGTVADVRWSSRWGEGGCGPASASWVMSLPFEADVPWLTPGAIVEVFVGGVRVWRGVLTEPKRGVPWQFEAIGVAARAQDFAALDSLSAPTTIPEDAVDRAISAGWAATSATGFSAVAFGEADPVSVNRLDSLLNNWAQTSALRWGVDKDGAAFAVADPTVVSWVLDAQDVEVGVADDSLYTVVVARHVSGVNADTPPEANAWDTVVVEDAAAIARWGRREYVLDLTKLGLITTAAAEDYAEQQLRDLTVPAWVNRLTVDGTTLRTLGGSPADPSLVEAGQVVRMFGTNDGLGRLSGELALDVVLGEVEHEDGSPVVTIAPVKLAPRTLADVIAAMEPRRTASEVFER